LVTQKHNNYVWKLSRNYNIRWFNAIVINNANITISNKQLLIKKSVRLKSAQSPERRGNSQDLLLCKRSKQISTAFSTKQQYTCTNTDRVVKNTTAAILLRLLIIIYVGIASVSRSHRGEKSRPRVNITRFLRVQIHTHTHRCNMTIYIRINTYMYTDNGFDIRLFRLRGA